MMTGDADARSIRMLRYSSRSISSPSSIEHAADLLALGSGLVRDQRHADHLLRELLDFVGRPGDLDAAALAAAAGVNLRLDDGHAAAEALGGVDRFGRCERNLAARDGNAEAREH